jgi:hypothetical protein
MQIALFFILSTLCLTSCGIYNSHFECPPGKGVGCASVGEVMDMIVEREEGEDLFLKNRGKPLLSGRKQKKCRKEKKLAVAQAESGELILITEKEEEKK